ncbi:MAG: hypothetical protein KGZ79_10955 [Dethiobacter sp.]|jgi:hypothetical protein|nr:hypothetical protein [Dethiobacter sp.]
MGRKKRLELIAQLEEKLNTSLVCYVTGDRENLSTRIAPDIIRIFYRHLKPMGEREKISLFLYTRGGDVLTPWRLVNLIREYCQHFSALIPFRSYSAGTLICLGADEIIMGKMGELSPIDPSVANAFNPRDPHNRTARIPVSVEDVISYISLAKEMGGLNHEEQLAEVFLRLSRVVHPLSLGNVHRNYLLIRSLGRKLLELHSGQSAQIESIIKNLSEELHAHNYMIPRHEAKNRVNLNVTAPSSEVEELMWSLYENYEDDLKLLSPFNPATLLDEQEQQIEFEATGGIIESIKKLDAFVFEGRVARQMQPGPDVPPVCLEILRQAWKAIE